MLSFAEKEFFVEECSCYHFILIEKEMSFLSLC